MDVIQILKDRGFETVARSFYTKIDTWRQWYDSAVEDFYKYKVYTGEQVVDQTRYSLGMPKKVCEDWAGFLLNEKVAITAEGEAEQAWIDSVFDHNNSRVALNEAQEDKFWSGTVAYVPHVTGAVLNETGEIEPDQGATIDIDIVTAPDIYPLSWHNKRITECAFAAAKRYQEDDYLYLQIHRRIDGQYVIENVLYKINAGRADEVPLDTIPELAGCVPVIYTGSMEPQFVIDRPNIINNTRDTVGNPLGISIFANAIDQIKGVDIAYDSYINEFVLGKKRIMVRGDAIKFDDGKPMFDSSEIVYYVLPSSGDFEEKKPIVPIDMTLRITEHSQGIQDHLNAFSSKCGMGESTYRFDKGSIATATQVVSENSALFRSMKKHELIIENALISLCRILLHMGNAYCGQSLNEDVAVSVDFDDSIIEDKATDFSRDMQMLSAGIMNDWEFRARWMNEDEATAKKALPNTDDLTKDEAEDDNPDEE